MNAQTRRNVIARTQAEAKVGDKRWIRVLSLSAAVLAAAMVINNQRLQASSTVLTDLDCVIEPSAVVDVGSAVPGLLSDAFVDRSDHIRAGEILGRLENGVELATLDIAREVAGSRTAIELRLASAEYGDRTKSRNDRLMNEAVVSRQALDQVTTEAKVAELQVRQEVEGQRLARLEVRRARAALERRNIRSPISGQVLQRYRSEGEYVDGDAVYQVAQLDPLHVEVIVPVDYLDLIKPNAKAQVRLDLPDQLGRDLQATVDRVDAVADAASGTFGARLVLHNPDGDIPSGVRCQVDVYAN